MTEAEEVPPIGGSLDRAQPSVTLAKLPLSRSKPDFGLDPAAQVGVAASRVMARGGAG